MVKNMKPKETVTQVGVVVGRFQVDALHENHTQLLDYVKNKHQKVLVLLGVAQVPGTELNPLDYNSRRLMIQEKYPEFICLPLVDVPSSDHIWSENVDKLVRSMLTPGQNATLYGGRDSFIPCYHGGLPVIELEQTAGNVDMSGTAVRERLSVVAQSSQAFRAGMIFQSFQRFPVVISPVDIAIINFKTMQLLLGKRAGSEHFRFPGGFSEKVDLTYEVTAKREAREETQLEVGEPYYIGSFPITKDRRYPTKGRDSLRTILFVAPYIYGKAEASDDLRGGVLQWFSLEEVKTLIDNQMITAEHTILANHLLDTITNPKAKYHFVVEQMKKAATETIETN